MKITEEQMREFCKDHYYCDTDDEGVRAKWEPFEYWEDEYIDAEIENDVCALTNFIKEINK